MHQEFRDLRGWRLDLRDQRDRTEQGVPRVDPIWKYDTTMEEIYAKQEGITRAAARKAIGTVRVNIGPIINAGLALCDG